MNQIEMGKPFQIEKVISGKLPVSNTVWLEFRFNVWERVEMLEDELGELSRMIKRGLYVLCK